MTIEDDVVAEGQRLAGSIPSEGLNLKLLGGVAVALACPDALGREELRRHYKDLDFAAPRARAKAITEMLVAEDYVADRTFNALHGASRLLFYDKHHGRQVDVFLDVFNMCHYLDLRSRFATPWAYLAPSDLLLMKLQIVQLNEKDLVDAIALTLQHKCGDQDTSESVNASYITQVCGRDWGWYTTVCDNIAIVRDQTRRILRSNSDAEVVTGRLTEMLEAIGDGPKSLKWKLRAQVGRRLRWFEVPDEVG